MSGAERQRAWRQRQAAARKAAQAEAARLAKREAFQQLPLPAVAGASEDELPRPGRPAGQVAKVAAEFRKLLLSRYRHPGIVLAELYSRPVDELAKDLGCTKLDALREQVRAAGELLPYVSSKMPIAVQTEGLPQVGITLAVSAETAAAMGMAGPPVPMPRTVVNQALSEGDDA